MTSVSAVAATMLLSGVSLPSVCFQLRKHCYCIDFQCSLTSASALQKHPRTIRSRLHKQTRHQSWLCIAPPSSRHTTPPEPDCRASINCRYDQRTFLQLETFLEKQLSKNCRWWRNPFQPFRWLKGWTQCTMQEFTPSISFQWGGEGNVSKGIGR